MFNALLSSISDFWKSDHFWDGITALSTAAAAIFTAIMARFTFRAIREGQGQRQETNQHFEQSRKQGEQHHQDSYRPLLALVPSFGSDVSSRGKVLTAHARQGGWFFQVHCILRNLGSGPALNVRLIVCASDQFGNVAAQELSPLEAGGVGDQKDNIYVGVQLTDRFNSTDLGFAAGWLWTLFLEYDDVFGNHFHTIHSKNADDPWCRVGKGPAPDPMRGIR